MKGYAGRIFTKKLVLGLGLTDSSIILALDFESAINKSFLRKPNSQNFICLELNRLHVFVMQ